MPAVVLNAWDTSIFGVCPGCATVSVPSTWRMGRMFLLLEPLAQALEGHAGDPAAASVGEPRY
jgi:hypothetical protein